MIVLSPKRITAVLAIVAIVLASISIGRNAYQQITGRDFRFGHVFSFNDQVNVPTWYSASLMLLCALLLLVIAWDSRVKGDRFTLQWGFLSLLFAFLSVNEVVYLHRRVFVFFLYVLPLPGKKYIGLLLLTVFIALFFYAYRRFLAHLPRRILIEFLTTATLYVSAIVIDKFDKRDYWQYIETFGAERSPGLLTTLDEMLELVGAIILIHAVLAYMSQQLKQITFQIGDR